MKRHFLIGSLTLIALSIVGIGKVSAQEATFCPAYGQEVVDVSLTIPADTVIAGANIPVSINLKNVSKLPIVGGSVLVRLTSADGNVFVRDFPATDLSLASEDTFSFVFDLVAPTTLPEGDYYIDALFVPNAGYLIENPDLSIDSRSGANTAMAQISLKNDVKSSAAYLDYSSMKVMANDDSAIVSVEFVNTSTSSISVPVIYKEYRWNAASETNLLGSVVEAVEVKPSSRTTIKRTVDITKHSSYTVLFEAQANGLKSFAAALLDGNGAEALVSSFGITRLDTGSLAAYGCVKNAFSDDTEKRFLRVAIGNDTGDYAIASGDDFEFLRDIAVETNQYNGAVSILSESGEVQSSFTKDFSCGLLDACPEDGSNAEKSDMLLEYTIIAAGIGGLITIWHHRRQRRLISVIK